MIHEYGAYIFYFFLGLGLMTFGLLVTTAICRINWFETKGEQHGSEETESVCKI